MTPPPPRSTLLPYTTLFRSGVVVLAIVLGFAGLRAAGVFEPPPPDRKSTRLNSSHRTISYAVFCLKKKTKPLLTRPSHHNFTASLQQLRTHVRARPLRSSVH